LTSWDQYGGGPTGYINLAVWCSYFYRNVPNFVDYATSAQGYDNQGSNMEYAVFGTRPVVKTTANAPMFKTDRQQGSRALASDSAERGGTHHKDITVGPPGRGYYAHKDGYNALYGDFSVRWYGDPQQRWIYFSMLAQRGKTGTNMRRNSLRNYYAWTWGWNPTYQFFHELDKAADVDMQASEDPYWWFWYAN